MDTMKTKLNFRWLFLQMLIAYFMIAMRSESMTQGQNSTDFKAFKITIEKTADGLRLQSLEGSAWIDLSFDIKNYNPQAIDEYGMTRLGKVSKIKDPNLADYLFTITKTQDGITLKGIEGTAWKEVTFSLQNNAKQSIDQFGMVQ